MSTHHHAHTHDGHTHSHPHLPAHPHNHVEDDNLTSRRDFFRFLMGGALAGASVLELASHRAAWATAASATAAHNLFNIGKAADGVYFAHARPLTIINCNAAIFVRSRDVVVVDAHSRPSSAAALLAQLKREVTDKPVRYLINTHFHWDHTQGDRAYLETGHKVDIIASNATKALLEGKTPTRTKAPLDTVPQLIENFTKRAEKASSAAEKAFCAEQIRQLKAYQADMKDFRLELPTITFDKSYQLDDPAFDLHLEFHGRAHTAGDIFVFCPQRRALASGDASHCWLPNIADGYPRLWPHTLDEVGQLDFKYLLGGHGPMQSDRTIMTCQRNYIEELVELVEVGKRAGQTLEEMKQRLTVAKLKSLQSNNYGAYVAKALSDDNTHFGPMPPLQNDVNDNIRDVYNNLDKA
jgi:glyoxylase-like metal-dependent hydrolase (beta-lactamase superfamily II)